MYQNKESAFENTLTEAVAEAKKYVYAKADVQLAAGNAKYQQLKQQWKDSQTELVALRLIAETSAQALKAKEADILQLNTDLLLLQSKHDALLTEYNYIVKSIKSNAEFNSEQEQLFTDGSKDALEVLRAKQSTLLTYEASELQWQSAKKLLETMLIEKETQWIEQNNMCVLLQNQLTERDAEVSRLGSSLREMEKESDMHLLLVAKLTTTNEQWESKHSALEQEKEELTSRCTTLRNMNNELMQMLESN